MERKIFGNGHHEKQEGGSCQDSGVSSAPACSGSSPGVLAADADTDPGGSDAAATFGQGRRFHGATAGGDGGETSRSGGQQEERDALELGTAGSLQGGEVNGEGARRRWQRGLRRMVDSDSPSVSNEQRRRPCEKERDGHV